MDFPGGGAPVAGTAWGGIKRLRFVFGVKEEPTADTDPAAVKMIAEGAGRPVFAVLFCENAHAGRDFDDDAAVFRAVQGVEDEFDMRVAFGRIRGVTIHCFDAANFYIPDIASDFRGVAIVPAAAIIAGFEHGGESDARIDLLRVGRGIAVFEAI